MSYKLDFHLFFHILFYTPGPIHIILSQFHNPRTPSASGIAQNVE